MTLSEKVSAASEALACGDAVGAERYARSAMQEAGCSDEQSRERGGGLPKWSAEVRELGFQAGLMLQKALHAQGKWAEARRATSGLRGMDWLKLYPILMLEAEASFQAGDWRWGAAANDASFALRGRPDAPQHFEICLAMARYNRRSGFFEAASVELGKAGKLLASFTPDGVTAARYHAERADLAMDWNNDVDGARKELQQALALDASNFAARLTMSDVEFDEPRRALEWLTPLESSNDPEVLARIGRATGLLGDFRRAEEYLERALSRSRSWYGQLHPITGWVLDQWGCLCEDRLEQGDATAGLREQMIDCFERACTVLAVNAGADHPWAMAAKESLAQYRPKKATKRSRAVADRYKGWMKLLERLEKRLPELSAGYLYKFEIGPPASRGEVEAVESVFGRQLPASFRDAMLGFSGRVRIDCQCDPYWAYLHWDLQELLTWQSEFQSWEGNIGGEPWDAWRNHLGFLRIDTGDFVVIELGSDDGEVLYFDHEWSGLEGAVLAPNFFEFVDRVIALGGVGHYSYKAFLGDGGLDISTPTARAWRKTVYGSLR